MESSRGKVGDWEEYKSIFKVEVKATRNVHSKEYVRHSKKWQKDEAGRLSVVQGTMLKSTDFLRRIIAPPGGPGGVTM